jgi:hypothetical protein
MKLPLTLQLKPSRIYLIVLMSGHALAGVAVCLLGWPWPACAAVLLLLALSLLRVWRQASSAAYAIQLRSDGKLELLRADASSVQAEIAGDSLVLPWLVVLHLHSETRIRPLVIWPDSLSGADDHRQLRIWLKWCATLAEKSGAA